jgi:hypothetical protein
MDPVDKTALRAAVLIHEQLAGGQRQDSPICLPEYSWNNIQRLRRQIDRARQRGWQRAARRLTEDLAGALDDCRRQLENAFRVLQSHPSKRRVSSASEIYRDILALYDEFEEVEIDLDEHTLSVTTDRIVLEDINFGRFEIRLDWRRLAEVLPYRVVALDPNPAAKSEDITHPHVQDEQLCEGDGHPAVQSALSQCRLHDFFLLISQLLYTYGRGSAYVELSNWYGVPCQDCGDSVDEDNQYSCDRCGGTLCSSCSISCHGCDNGFCSGCVGPCCRCGGEFCSSCLKRCPVCRQQFCEECREGGLCHACHQKQQEEDPENDPSEDARNEPVVIPA